MKEQCNARVWHRDTYRRTGRGKSGFTMHYAERQCTRDAVNGQLCRQHFEMTKRRYVVLWDMRR